MSACADAVWALDGYGGVLIRTLSKTCPTGMHWTRLDLSQLGEFDCFVGKLLIIIYPVYMPSVGKNRSAMHLNI